MFALVANGAVNAVSKTTYAVSGGTWMPLIEDPATYSPSEAQLPDGFTVGEDLVIRHWRLKPRPATVDDVTQVQAQVQALADALVATTAAAKQGALTDQLAAAGLVQANETEAA